MPDPLNVQPGAIFAGDYRILRPLSVGGMGAVYVAEQISTGKQRALKLMLSQLVADPSLRKRFEQEARIASLIESEHVVEVVGAGVDLTAGVPWLAMELLIGEDLAKTVARRGAVPISEVLVIFEQLCHALGAAHRANIVHRDLKPENVFLSQAKRAGVTFTVKVLDFGIAKIVAEAKTGQTAAIGSPIWMAPEQADRTPITPATDVWALGLLAFYLLTGRYYWKSANVNDATIPQLMREVLFEPIVVASQRTQELGVTLPPAFDGWFGRCVVREPAGRFSDASQAWAALVAALGSTGPGRVLTERPQAMPSFETMQPPLAITTPSAGGVTGAAGAYTVANSGDPRVPTGARSAPKSSSMAILAVALVAVILGVSIGGAVWYKVRSSSAAATAIASDAAPSTTSPLSASSAASGTVAAADPPAAEDLDPLTAPVPPPPPPPEKPHAAPGPAAASPTAAQPVAKPSAQPAAQPGAQPAAQPASAPASPVPAPTPAKTAYDLARSPNPADWQTAHAMLEPDVYAGRATVYNIRLLEFVCKQQRDRACLKECKRQLRSH